MKNTILYLSFLTIFFIASCNTKSTCNVLSRQEKDKIRRTFLQNHFDVRFIDDLLHFSNLKKLSFKDIIIELGESEASEGILLFHLKKHYGDNILPENTKKLIKKSLESFTKKPEDSKFSEDKVSAQDADDEQNQGHMDDKVTILTEILNKIPRLNEEFKKIFIKACVREGFTIQAIYDDLGEGTKSKIIQTIQRQFKCYRTAFTTMEIKDKFKSYIMEKTSQEEKDEVNNFNNFVDVSKGKYSVILSNKDKVKFKNPRKKLACLTPDSKHGIALKKIFLQIDGIGYRFDEYFFKICADEDYSLKTLFGDIYLNAIKQGYFSDIKMELHNPIKVNYWYSSEFFSLLEGYGYYLTKDQIIEFSKKIVNYVLSKKTQRNENALKEKNADDDEKNGFSADIDENLSNNENESYTYNSPHGHDVNNFYEKVNEHIKKQKTYDINDGEDEKSNTNNDYNDDNEESEKFSDHYQGNNSCNQKNLRVGLSTICEEDENSSKEDYESDNEQPNESEIQGNKHQITKPIKTKNRSVEDYAYLGPPYYEYVRRGRNKAEDIKNKYYLIDLYLKIKDKKDVENSKLLKLLSEIWKLINFYNDFFSKKPSRCENRSEFLKLKKAYFNFFDHVIKLFFDDTENNYRFEQHFATFVKIDYDKGEICYSHNGTDPVKIKQEYNEGETKDIVFWCLYHGFNYLKKLECWYNFDGNNQHNKKLLPFNTTQNSKNKNKENLNESKNDITTLKIKTKLRNLVRKLTCPEGLWKLTDKATINRFLLAFLKSIDDTLHTNYSSEYKPLKNHNLINSDTLKLALNRTFDNYFLRNTDIDFFFMNLPCLIEESLSSCYNYKCKYCGDFFTEIAYCQERTCINKHSISFLDRRSKFLNKLHQKLLSKKPSNLTPKKLKEKYENFFKSCLKYFFTVKVNNLFLNKYSKVSEKDFFDKRFSILKKYIPTLNFNELNTNIQLSSEDDCVIFELKKEFILEPEYKQKIINTMMASHDEYDDLKRRLITRLTISI